MTSSLIVQHAVPHYRLDVFENVKREHEDVQIMSGTRTLDGAVSAPNAADLVDHEGRLLSFGPFGAFLGQYRLRLHADVLIMPLNARLVDQWMLLIGRRLARKKTFLWGHYRSRGRSGPGHLRRAMVWLSSGVLAYTSSDGDRFRKTQSRRVLVARNSAHEFDGTCTRKVGDWRYGILVLGRISEAKRVLDSLDVLQSVVDDSPELPWRLYIVGRGEHALEQELKDRISQHPHSDRIEFLGQVSDTSGLEDIGSRCAHHLIPGYAGLNVIDATSLGLISIMADADVHAPEWEEVNVVGGLSLVRNESAAGFGREIIRLSKELQEDELCHTARWARDTFRPSATAAVVVDALRGSS